MIFEFFEFLHSLAKFIYFKVREIIKKLVNGILKSRIAF